MRERSHPCTVSLYWFEKVLLLLDSLQVFSLLWVILQPRFPFHWNIETKFFLIFNLDLANLAFRPLRDSNLRGEYTFDIVQRVMYSILWILFPLLLHIILEVIYLKTDHGKWNIIKKEELDKTTKTITETTRRSSVKMSISSLYAFVRENDLNSWKKFRSKSIEILLHNAKILIILSTYRNIFVLIIFAPMNVAILPQVFCEDQSSVCQSKSFLVWRIILGVCNLTVAVYWMEKIRRAIKKQVLSNEDSEHEEYLQQKELEYLLCLTNTWRQKNFWIFSSFKRSLLRVYHRYILMLVKFILCFVYSNWGQSPYKMTTGLAYIFFLASPPPEKPEGNPEDQENSTLTQDLLYFPMGSTSQAFVAFIFILLFFLLTVSKLPYRMKSSNTLYCIVWIYILIFTALGTFATVGNNRIAVFLPQNLVYLLFVLLEVIVILCFLFFACCCFRAVNLHAVIMGKLKENVLFEFKARKLDGKNLQKSDSDGITLRSVRSVGISHNLMWLQNRWPITQEAGEYLWKQYTHLMKTLKNAHDLLEKYSLVEKVFVPVSVFDAVHKELCDNIILYFDFSEACNKKFQSIFLVRHDEEKSDPIESCYYSRSKMPSSRFFKKFASFAEIEYKHNKEVLAKNENEEMANLLKIMLKDLRISPKKEVNKFIETESKRVAFSKNLMQPKFLGYSPYESQETFVKHRKEFFDQQKYHRAFQWILLETYDTFDIMRQEVQVASLLRNPFHGGEELMINFRRVLERRDRNLSFIRPKNRRIILKLLSVQFLCGKYLKSKRRNSQYGLAMGFSDLSDYFHGIDGVDFVADFGFDELISEDLETARQC